LITLIAEVCGANGNTPYARQMASIVFKNTIINATNEESGDNLWYTIDDKTRGFIKEALLTNLGKEDKMDVKNAGICLGILAAVEVPAGKWDEFLPMMA